MNPLSFISAPGCYHCSSAQEVDVTKGGFESSMKIYLLMCFCCVPPPEKKIRMWVFFCEKKHKKSPPTALFFGVKQRVWFEHIETIRGSCAWLWKLRLMESLCDGISWSTRSSTAFQQPLVSTLVGGLEHVVNWKSMGPWGLGCDYPIIYHDILVGGLEHEFYFPIYWECHNPNWRTHVF